LRNCKYKSEIDQVTLSASEGAVLQENKAKAGNDSFSTDELTFTLKNLEFRRLNKGCSVKRLACAFTKECAAL